VARRMHIAFGRCRVPTCYNTPGILILLLAAGPAVRHSCPFTGVRVHGEVCRYRSFFLQESALSLRVEREDLRGAYSALCSDRQGHTRDARMGEKDVHS
jgi:hypothetical protein